MGETGTTGDSWKMLAFVFWLSCKHMNNCNKSRPVENFVSGGDIVRSIHTLHRVFHRMEAEKPPFSTVSALVSTGVDSVLHSAGRFAGMFSTMAKMGTIAHEKQMDFGLFEWICNKKRCR